MSWSIFPPYPTHLILKSKSTYPLRFLLLFTDGSYLQRRLLVTGSYLHWATCSAHRSELVTILITLDQSLAEQMFSVCQSPVCMWGLLRAAEALTITETQLHDTIFPSTVWNPCFADLLLRQKYWNISKQADIWFALLIFPGSDVRSPSLSTHCSAPCLSYATRIFIAGMDGQCNPTCLIHQASGSFSTSIPLHLRGGGGAIGTGS